MAEKRGGLEKMRFDFVTHNVLEVYLPNLKDKPTEGWYRVTAQEFRSFDGPRRYHEIDHQPALGEMLPFIRGEVDIPFYTYEYQGPVYIYGTNRIVEQKNTCTIIRNAEWDDIVNKAEALAARNVGY